MTNDLAAWLLEQITEDETAARAAHSYLVEHAAAFYSEDDPPYGWQRSWEGFGRSGWTEPSGQPISSHIARWNPAHVLAECDAKRRILARHAPKVGTEYGPFEGELICGCSGGTDEFHAVPWPCADVRDIASVYADRPGYEEEAWRP